MPESTAELVKAAFAAVNRRDADALVALCTDDVQFRPIIATVDESYRGPDGVRRWLAEIARRFPEGRTTFDHLEDRGDAAIVTGVTSARGLSFQWHLAARVREGLIAAWSFHPSREHAERALG